MSKTKARIIQTTTVILLCVAAIFISIADFSSCVPDRQPGDRVSETRVLMDTYCTITIGNVEKERLIDEAFRLCEQMDALFSMRSEGSDIWRINNAGGEEVSVDRLTYDLIIKGLEFGELSGGMFDITIGKLSSLWDFGGELSGNPGIKGIPERFEINTARMTIDYKFIGYYERDGEYFIKLENPATWLDLGAIAKGFMADRVASFLTENGVDSAIIDLGGDIVVIGSRPDGEPWRLGIAKPFSDTGEIIGVIEHSNVAVVSSGVYERQFVSDGTRYHHILDPNTGMPVVNEIIAATVISDSALTGEGLSTIAVLVGSQRAEEIFLQTPGFIGAVLILDDDSVLTIGEVQVIPLS